MNRRLLLSMLALCLGVSALIGIRTSGATYTEDSTTGASVFAANDWTPPSVVVTSPGATVSGTVTVAAVVSDARGTVVSVATEYRVAGATTWSAQCTDTTSPWSCAWDTSVLTDGSYELRAIATDDSGNRGTSATVTTEVVTDRGFVTLRSPGDVVRGTVTLQATSSLWFVATGYVLEYAPAGTSSWTTACTTSSTWYPATSCSWDTSSLTGRYDLRVRASTTSYGSAVSVVRDVLVDNTDPTVSLEVPAGPWSGAVQLEARAADSHSGLSSVSVQTRAAGGAWTICGTGTTSPSVCSLDTTKVVDGSYEVRAVATDVAGNQAITTTLTRPVVNVAGSVSITSPSAGATVRGTAVTLSATASATRGVASVRFEVRPAGSPGWVLVCTTVSAPYSCAADATTAPQGSFDVRAVMADRAGALFTSPVVTVTVDNTPPRAYDVQAVNGGTSGRADRGDRLVLTFSDEVATSSILSGWNGTPTTVSPTLFEKATYGSASSTRDNLVLSGTGLGSVSFTQSYLGGGKVTFTGSTMSASTTTLSGRTVTVVTLTLGTGSTTSGLTTDTSSGAMTWTPGTGLLSPDGLLAGTAPVTESGQVDKDF